MPNKYSHGLVLAQQQYRGIINPHPTSSIKPPSSRRNPAPHTRSTASSVSSLSDYSAQSAVISDYIRIEPDPEQEPSHPSGNSTHTHRPSLSSTLSDAPPFKSPSSEPSRPPSERLRLESPFGFRIEDLPSPPPRPEPRLPQRPYHERSPSYRPNFESPPQERLRLVDPSSLGPRSRRPSLHHKSSSIETQIYAPQRTISRPPTREGKNLASVDVPKPHHSPSPKHDRQYHSCVPTPQKGQDQPSDPFPQDTRHGSSPTFAQGRQHVFSMESPESSPPPSSTGDRQERFSSETWRTYLHSPTRDRRQSFVQKTQALASPQPVQVGLANSPFGMDSPTLFSSTRGFQDYFSIEKQDSESTSAATGDRQNIARSPLPTPSQNGRVRPSMEIQRMQTPTQTQEYGRRPSLEAQRFSPHSQPQIRLQSVHGRRQSSNSQTIRTPQDPPFLGPRRLSLDKSIKETQHSRTHSISSTIAQERQPRPSMSTQQLTLEQLIEESEPIREPLIDPQTYSSQMSSASTGKSVSRQTSSASAQRYTPKNTSLKHSPRSRRERPLKLPDTLASRHKTLLPTIEGAYDDVFIETHGFPPERPPSPPATPDSRKNFSLAQQAAESQRTRPPPIPQRSARRSPPRQRSAFASTNPSVVDLPVEPPRPKTAPSIDAATKSRTVLHSPTFSISTRRSSINATRSPPSMSFSDFSDTMTSPQREPFSQSRDKGYFDDADLEALPPEIDFNVLPFEDPNAGPAIFRATQLGLEDPISPSYEDPNDRPAVLRATQLGIPVSDDGAKLPRVSSFDSVAPPPIGLTRRTSHATADLHQPKVPKKEGKPSLLSFLRSMPAPKAVLYPEATQGKPPAPMSVSRTAVPSVPMLFPGFRSGPEPRMRPGLDPKTSAPRSPAHMDAAEKRKSWIKDDGANNKSRRASRLEKKREFHRILNNL